MAEGKNIVNWYADWGYVLDNLNLEQKGMFIHWFGEYVRDLDPELPEDPFVAGMIIPIKQTLKRDLKKWERRREANRSNGALGGRPRATPKEKKLPKVPSMTTEQKEVATASYSKQDFLRDWNKIRELELKKKSALNSINSYEAVENFNKIVKNYDANAIRSALAGLFKQKKFPRGSGSFTTDPNHFLKFFERYLQAWNDQDFNLYPDNNT